MIDIRLCLLDLISEDADLFIDIAICYKRFIWLRTIHAVHCIGQFFSIGQGFDT